MENFLIISTINRPTFSMAFKEQNKKKVKL